VKIALTHIRQAWSGGTEGYLNQLSSYLAEQGHEVTIVCRRHQETPHAAIRFVVLRPATLGVGHRVWRFARDVDRHLDYAAYDVVYGLGRTWRQDVLRLGGGCHLSYLECSRPHTASWAQRYLASGLFKHALYRWIEKRTLNPHTRQTIVCNAEMVKTDIINRYGVPDERIIVIGNGVDLKRFDPDHRGTQGNDLRRACGFERGETVLLFLGSGYKRKGLDLLLRAMPEVIQHSPDARLLVVGFDNQVAVFKRMAHQLGVARQVVFLGGRQDVTACYAASDLYILPTRYDPFANSTLEALATGLPVITTSANGGSELLTEGVHGSIVTPDVAPITRAIEHWMDSEQRRSAGDAARRLAVQHGSPSKLRATLTLLETLAVQGQTAAGRSGSPERR
jgi:UDP-glucose:(heptosyl)LPS alpha-1,3-glucosyltransferase